MVMGMFLKKFRRERRAARIDAATCQKPRNTSKKTRNDETLIQRTGPGNNPDRTNNAETPY
jgi:hypothetical protein